MFQLISKCNVKATCTSKRWLLWDKNNGSQRSSPYH